MSAVFPNFSPSAVATDQLCHLLLMQSLIKDIRTAIPVKVMAVYPGAGTPPSIGTVDVQPLVQTVDGSGKRWSLGVTYGASFGRIQAGNTAFIIDPSAEDIGIAIACDRDVSSAIAAALAAIAAGQSVQPAGPGSARTHDISDLIYLFSIVSAKPITQYIVANADGITLLSPNTITIQGAQINMTGPINANGALISSAGEITDALGVVVGTHTHSGVSTGSGDTGPPVA
jgi:hypothetical protein